MEGDGIWASRIVGRSANARMLGSVLGGDEAFELAKSLLGGDGLEQALGAVEPSHRGIVELALGGLGFDISDDGEREIAILVLSAIAGTGEELPRPPEPAVLRARLDGRDVTLGIS